jgi:hypothetical protein
MSWILNELVAKRPLLPHEQPLTSEEFGFSDPVVDCLETFRMITEVREGVSLVWSRICKLFPLEGLDPSWPGRKLSPS